MSFQKIVVGLLLLIIKDLMGNRFNMKQRECMKNYDAVIYAMKFMETKGD